MASRRRHGSASVEEHPKGSGKWRVRARIGGKLGTLASGLTEPQATAAADAYRDERDAGLLREGITLAQFGPTFFQLRRRRGVRAVAKDENRFKCYVEEDKIGGLPLKEIRRVDVVEWRDRLLRNLAAQTVRNALNLVRVALAEALDRELVTENVARDVRVPRALDAKPEDDLGGVMLPDEQMALLKAVPAGFQPLVMVALLTGLRWSELAYLRREDVIGDVLHVRRSVGGGPTKSGKARRVPLLGPARGALDRQLGTVPRSCPWVFPSSEGGPRKFRPNGWGSWVKAAGITRRVRWHDLRHTCATSLLAGWWSTDGHRWTLDEVCAMLGHASLTTTERYARKVDETLQNAAARLVVIAFPAGSTEAPKLPETGTDARIPKPWVGCSSQPGGASDIIDVSGGPAPSPGNSLGSGKPGIAKAWERALDAALTATADDIAAGGRRG